MEKGESTILESKGHYLLVDIGAASHASMIADQLNEMGVTHVDIMISHLHNDHMGGNEQNAAEGLEQLRLEGIVVDTLYLPDPNLAPRSQRFPQRYAQIRNFMLQQETGTIVYLSAGSKLAFGDVEGEVIGPIEPWKRTPDQYTQYKTLETRYINYENDTSLAVIFTCGKTRYFTAGDCYGAEADDLVATYGKELRCDIMKLNHHGIGNGNSEALIGAVKPKYTFVPNSGVQNVSTTTGRWRSYTATKRATQYGMCYLLGSEAETLIYHIVNDKITLYRGDMIDIGEKMSGWQYLYGADGLKRDHDMYYIDDDGVVAKGMKQIGDRYYRFKPGGQMDYGNCVVGGDVEGWKAFSGGDRYYRLSDDGKYAYVSYGFDTIDDFLYYFDQDGFLIKSREKDMVEICQIGSDHYAVNTDGILTTNDWEIIDDSFYYLDESGRMIYDCKYKLDDDYYLFDIDGTLIMGEGRTQFYRFESDTYAVRADGTLVAGKLAKLNDEKYYFDEEGVMQKNALVQVGKKLYYFGKDGKLVHDKKFVLKGKKYYSNSRGIVSEMSV